MVVEGRVDDLSHAPRIQPKIEKADDSARR
jgi:hypothetical protein